MKVASLVFLFHFILLNNLNAQENYYPPLIGTTWETVEPAELDWCEEGIEPLCEFLDNNNSKAFIVLHQGKIVIEKYFDDFQQDSLWYWASAGKCLTSFLVGKAQEDGLLSIEDPANQYLGEGWTSCTLEQENAIKIRHQLTMTSGLDDGIGDVFCSDSECLLYLEDPEDRWAYHNGPYTNLHGVIENASGLTINQYVFQEMFFSIGLAGTFIPLDGLNLFWSNARQMARFGLLMESNGSWNGETVMTDSEYFNNMINPSQELNKSYGYLWWLNGQESYMVPQSQVVWPGSINSEAPDDMYSAIGKNGQIINVVPSLDLVMIRMGNDPTDQGSLVPWEFNSEIWSYMNNILCTDNSLNENSINKISTSPNPSAGIIKIKTDFPFEKLSIYNAVGNKVHEDIFSKEYDLRHLGPGLYIGFLDDFHHKFSFIIE